MSKFYPRGMRGILREKALTLKKKIQLYSKRKIPQMTVADLILIAAGELKDVDVSPFTRKHIKEMLPDVNPSTVSVQIQSMTINTPGHGACGEKYRKKCFERVARGQYVFTPYGENLLGEIKNQFFNGKEQKIVLRKPAHEKGEDQVIEIPQITLNWSTWFPWRSLEIPREVRVPDDKGVYEAKYGDSDERLTIGKASNLRMRVKQGLVKGKLPHSSGRRIREKEDTSKIVIRWAITDRPACVEEELHDIHRSEFGGLPKHTRA